jgi:glycosyltransferase involved in cell wall biosynthesis
MKNIGIDFHVVDGKYQGSRTHIIEVFKRVIQFGSEFKFFLFHSDKTILNCAPEIYQSPNVRFVYMPACSPLKRLLWYLPLYQVKYSLDILHTQYICPIPRLTACVVTIHDILFETHPHFFEPFFVVRSKVLMRYSARKSRHVFTVSQFSKQEIISRYHLNACDISVVCNGVDVSKFKPDGSGTDYILARGLASGQYILSVGRLEPRKNHLNLLSAYAKLSPNAFPLVLVGQKFFGYNDIYEEINRLNLSNRVIVVEDATDEELPALYRHAAFFVYPSWAEGFGIPPLEAMASGTPVITSNSTAIPEVAGECALLVSPGDVDEIAVSMQLLLDSPMLRKKMAADGLAQAQKFVWENAALTTLEVYRSLVR